MYQVIRSLWNGFEVEATNFLIENVAKNPNIVAGVMYGGQQALDWLNGKLSIPMGMARLLFTEGHETPNTL